LAEFFVLLCIAVDKSDQVLLALFQDEIDRSESDFLKFRDSVLRWQNDTPAIYFQEWYTQCIRQIRTIWDGPRTDQDQTLLGCERTYELYGSAGTGKTIAGLVMINEFGKYADRPDILYVRHKRTLHARTKFEEHATATLLYRDYWGRARHVTVSSRFDESDREVIHQMLLSRQLDRKLCVLIDTYPPVRVLQLLDDMYVTMHMCVYIASYGSRISAMAGDAIWPFKPENCRLVSAVSKADYLKFGYVCAPSQTQDWINSTIASGKGIGTASSTTTSSSSSNNSITSGNIADVVDNGGCSSSTSSSAAATAAVIEANREALMSFAHEILGGSASCLLRLGTHSKKVRNATLLASVLRWFMEGGNNPTDTMQIAVLEACAQMTCWYIQEHEKQNPGDIVHQQAHGSHTEFSSLFLRQVRDPNALSEVRSVAASVTMLYVLFEIAQSRETKMGNHIMQAFGMGFQLEHFPLIYLYKYMQGNRELTLTGIGNRMRGLSMTINLGTLGLQLNTVTEEKKVEDLRVNDFAVCVNENFAMIDGICILPASVTVKSVVNRQGKPVSLVGDERDPTFFVCGRMKKKGFLGVTQSEDNIVVMDDLKETGGVALGLQVVFGSTHKLGRQADVLSAYRQGMIDNHFPSLLVMLFYVTDANFDNFDVTDEPDGSNLLCFKFPCQRSLKRASSEIAQGSSQEEDEEDKGEQKKSATGKETNRKAKKSKK
jgi:hypothetical protein